MIFNSSNIPFSSDLGNSNNNKIEFNQIHSSTESSCGASIGYGQVQSPPPPPISSTSQQQHQNNHHHEPHILEQNMPLSPNPTTTTPAQSVTIVTSSAQQDCQNQHRQGLVFELLENTFSLKIPFLIPARLMNK